MRRLLLSSMALSLLSAEPAWASATAGAEAKPPRLLAERGLIVWDPSQGRQHLLMTVELEPSEGPAGLIVQIPLPPVVEPVESELGEALLRLFAMHEERSDIAVTSFPEASGEANGRVLQAADAGSLGGFLESNGMAAYPGLARFARIYGARAFHYVALRLPDNGHDRARILPWTAISFLTPRPYYPLATPEEAIFGSGSAQRSRLEVYTLSPELLALTVGEFDTGSAVRLERHDLVQALGGSLMSAFGLEEEGSALWLQRFEPMRLSIESEDGFFVRIPEPTPKSIPSETRVPAKHAKRFLALAIATVFAIAITLVDSQLPSKPKR